jgi:hypothetical protein
MLTIANMYESLLRGKSVPMPDGKRARPTSAARTCSKCGGSKRVTEEQSAAASFRYLDAPCEECWGTGKVVDFVVEDDPTVLQPWVGSKFTVGGGFAERHRADGERVAYVENDQGGISIGIEPPGGRSYTIHLGADYNDTIGKPKANLAACEALTWAIALRLADAELEALGSKP